MFDVRHLPNPYFDPKLKEFTGEDRRVVAFLDRHPEVKEVRGAGVMRGIELNMDPATIVPAGLRHGVVVNRTAENVIRLG